MPKPAVSKPRRFCAFCGGAGLSREHFWPLWMHPYLPNGPRQALHVEHSEVRERSVIVAPPRHIERQGGTRTKTMKVVCRTCNSGWMGTIEEAAKPFLIPMLLGQAITLEKAARAAVTNWVALKAMVADANVTMDTVLTQQQRAQFRLGRVIPESFSVYLGRTFGTDWSSMFRRHAATVSFDPRAGLPATCKNVQVMMFGANQLYIALFLDEAKVGLHISGSLAPKLPKMCPGDDEFLGWPPAAGMLSDVEATAIAEGFERLIQSPRSRWMPRPGKPET